VSGTPFVSFFAPVEMMAMARDAGFGKVQCVPATMLAKKYFADRQDGLLPSNAEEILLAST
jgi:hypothetical protein